MDFLIVILICAAVFGVCFLFDKGFSALFRGKAEHKTGLSVRLSKRYASFGLILGVVGIAALFQGTSAGWLLAVGGGVLLLLGVALVIYYMSFGIFYDTDTFVLTTFGKRSTIYRYEQIRGQQLYISYGNVIVELHMTDGRTVQLQSGMEGAYPFLDYAFEAWLRQKGMTVQQCPFHDPDKSCWFPQFEE